MYAARRSSRCEGASASLGSSRSVRAKSLDILMDESGYRPPRACTGRPPSDATDQVHGLLPVLGRTGAVRLRVLVHHGHRGRVEGVAVDRVEIAPPLRTTDGLHPGFALGKQGDLGDGRPHRDLRNVSGEVL